MTDQEDQHDPGNQSGPKDVGHNDEGTDLARQIARGLAGRTGKARPRIPRTPKARPTSDGRDPATLDDTLQRLVDERGWGADVRVHSLFVRWSAIVGPEVAQHVTPVSFADARLVVQADSTAWATQMKLLAASIVRRLNEELGDETVRFVDVLGPQAPRRTQGRLRVKGRGLRDTFG